MTELKNNQSKAPQKLPDKSMPLIYSCSGCSNIAQLANQIAVDFDRTKTAEMSCIAGIGGGVKKLVKLAKSQRRIIALDGCHLHCVENCLALIDVKADHHITLTDLGIKKRYHENCSDQDLNHAKQAIMKTIQSS